jgi:hypothetical protein
MLATRAGQYPLLLELKEDPAFAHPLDQVKEILERFSELEHRKDEDN